MLESLIERADWKLPIAGLAFVTVGCLILLSPLGRGDTGLYGFAPSDTPFAVREVLIQNEMNPEEPKATLDLAEVLINEGQLVGNTEAIAAAELMLASLPTKSNFATEDSLRLNLWAIAQQHLHNFDKALDLLNLSLSINHSDVTAIFTRANILIIQGKLIEGQQACQSIAKSTRNDLFILCDTKAKALGPHASESFKRLNKLVISGQMAPSLLGYTYSVLGEISMFQGDYMQSQSLLQKAQSADPHNVRIRMLHADTLLALGKPEEALDVLDVPADNDALTIRRAIAYKRNGQKQDFKKTCRKIERLIALNRRAGHTGHAREESLYYLHATNEPLKALERATVNWNHQRELEDAILLLDAASAAQAPDYAIKVKAWINQENVTAIKINSRIAAMKLNTE